jgi:hypothetical protein
MSQQQPKVIACPACGNVNAYTADECIKCGLALEPIREALAKAGDTVAADIPTGLSQPPKSREPAPPLPELPPRSTGANLGNYVDGRQILIRGMGDRAEEVAARFFKQLAERGIQDVTLSFGNLITPVEGGKTDTREYYFAERDLGKQAVATTAIRIAPIGTDLFVEWRHYELPPITGDVNWIIFVFLLIFYIVPALIYYYWVKNMARAFNLIGFQSQDSAAFQLAVRAALEEAIDLAGISKSLIQRMSKEEGQDKRLI